MYTILFWLECKDGSGGLLVTESLFNKSLLVAESLFVKSGRDSKSAFISSSKCSFGEAIK